MVINLLVWEYISHKLRKERLHLTLLDPNKQEPEVAGLMSAHASDSGTDGIMIGGSTGVSRESFEATISEIKGQISLPVIIFPTSATSLSQNADAIFFMSLLNSKNIQFITREQFQGARFVKHTGLETIPMGYIIVSPGMMVGEVGQAELIERSDFESAVNYSLMAQYFGMKLVYLEAGSGAPEPVPTNMVNNVKKNINIPLIIGGGIRDPKAAENIAKAGADIIVTGTVVEDATNIKSTLEKIISSIKEIPKENS
jgi:phosphoglycerol geranylgeranyltransferase